MHTTDTLTQAIDEIVAKNYYGEDFELAGSFRALLAGLSDGERELLAEVAAERLSRSGSLVDVLLCGLVPSARSEMVLVEALTGERVTSQRSRALLTAMRTCSGDGAYVAVERFLDSDQEMDALQCLAAIDFGRSLPVLAKGLRQPHTAAVVVHVLHERRKVHGLERLLQCLRGSSVCRSPVFVSHLERALRAKEEAYNPFTLEEIEAILATLRKP
ncbi:MAG TPA: hypothetical protein PKE55_11705 [Kiritimatiellia bacterium]|nr:hypothetical protein [Kiritimatiellia bacterium]